MPASASLVSAVWLAVLLASTGRERASEEDARRTAARIRDGDRTAFRRFFDATHADFLRALRRRGLDAAAAEDVAQKAYVWLWEHRDRIDETKSLRGLLFRIGLTRGLNHLRDHGRTESLPDFELAGEREGDPAALADLRRALAEAVAALPERRRETFALCFTDGLTHREAAEVMDVSPRTVEHQMAHALKAIRAHLAPFLDEPIPRTEKS
ncbi:MAG: sigma-70 family RNA polymerase sigma factor [Rhodothermales bacterium]